MDQFATESSIRATPEATPYATATQRPGLTGSKCVFIDEAERNVEAARASGKPAVYCRIDRSDDLHTRLKELGAEAPDAA